MSEGKDAADVAPGGEGFARRWSRLKRQCEAGEPPAEETGDATAPQEAVTADAPAVPVEDPRSDKDILAELGLPDPDTLGPGDDFTALLKAELPARLRRRVLRRLWLSDPALANLDELLEYGEDYSQAVTGIVETVYQVGRGMLESAGAASDRRDGAGAGGAGTRPETGKVGEQGPERDEAQAAPSREAWTSSERDSDGTGSDGAEDDTEAQAATNERNDPGAGQAEDDAARSASPVRRRRPRIRFRFSRA